MQVKSNASEYQHKSLREEKLEKIRLDMDYKNS